MSKLALVFQFVLLCIFSGSVAAEIFDDITLSPGANGEVDATLRFSVPVQYSRHFPLRKSADMSIYFNLVGNVPRDEWQNYEAHRSPTSDVIRSFTVTTRDLSTGPKVEIQFTHPVEFTVSAGRDDHSILLHIKPLAPEQKKETKPALPTVGVAPVPPIGALTPAVVAPAPVVPAVQAAAAAPAPAQQAASAPTAAAPVIPAPAAPAGAAAPVPPVVAVALPVPEGRPSVLPLPESAATAPASSGAAVPQLGGGAEGLPLFPRVEPVVPTAEKAKTAEPLSLPEQMKRVNDQAAGWMIKGRDAVLTGQMFAAIDAFNNVLKLPPSKYSADAQVWIGIAREKAGQSAKAIPEYELYLKLYPEGKEAAWIKKRLAILNSIPRPAAPVSLAATPAGAASTGAAAKGPVRAPATEFQTTQYGSFSMYYYHGASQTDTVATIGNVQTPKTLTLTDQSTLITNVSMTARSYNNEFDNRFVFQDFNAKSFLQGQTNKNRLNAAYYDVKNRVDNYSARIGRQSALGGGVLGRFDGIAAGYGFLPNWRANIATGQLSDTTLDAKPVFISLGIDFGVNAPLGGSTYFINQKVGGLVDRKAVGGNLRYFEQGMTAMGMLDYDLQFKAVNILNLQGTLNYDSGTDYNLYIDRRRSPVLDIRNAVNGTTATISNLLQNGWTTDDLVQLAKTRTAISNVALVGVTQRVKEKIQVGADLSVSNTSSLQASGTLNPDGTTGIEGFVGAAPATGNAWTLNGRVSGSDLISPRDMSLCSLSYYKSKLSKGQMLLLYNHAYPRELWTLDSTLRLNWSSDYTGGKVNTIAPVLRLGYRLKNSLTLEGEGGIDLTKSTPAAMPASNSTRKYFSFGFRWDL